MPLSVAVENHGGSSNQGELQFSRGELVFQTAWYNEEQMRYIYDHCKTKMDRKKLAKIVFGDNNEDKFRNKGVKRKYFGGQAGVMGYYDRLFAYGITTTFHNNKLPELGNFMHFIDQQFVGLQQHLLRGNDVIIPKPRRKDVNANKKRYYKDGKQIIFHNLGTGIASLPFKYIAYIQLKIDELKRYARNTRTVRYYGYSPIKKNNDDDIKDKLIEREIYQCPLCREERHYLINLQNCLHSICEECLRGHIYQCLVYEDNPMGGDRFKCTLCRAANFKYSSGQICINDIKYSDDRCTCNKCKENNSDMGTGSILDLERYKQFKIIINAINTKKKYDKSECPQCLKPFTITKPWKKKKEDIDHDYNIDNDGNEGDDRFMIIKHDSSDLDDDTDEPDRDYMRKKTFFSKNMDHCNCCGEKYAEEKEEEEEEVATIAYGGFNNCNICNNYYCDNCRRNCFMKLNQK